MGELQELWRCSRCGEEYVSVVKLTEAYCSKNHRMKRVGPRLDPTKMTRKEVA